MYIESLLQRDNLHVKNMYKMDWTGHTVVVTNN